MIFVNSTGDITPQTLKLGEGVAIPVPADRQILIKIAYTAVNRADTLQRMGRYKMRMLLHTLSRTRHNKHACGCVCLFVCVRMFDQDCLHCCQPCRHTPANGTVIFFFRFLVS
jgi:hypothetical protein